MAGKAHARPQSKPAVLHLDGFGKAFDNAPTHPLEERACNRTADHHRVFVAAEAVDPGFAIADLLEDFGAFADRRIADEVTIVVVYQLETVEIDHGEGDFVALSVLMLEVGMQRTAIGQKCQTVAERKLFDAADIADPDKCRNRGCDAERHGAENEDRGRSREAEKTIGQCRGPCQKKASAQRRHGTKYDGPRTGARM